MTKFVKFPFKEDEDGTVTFNFKSQNPPKLYDSDNKRIINTMSLNIGGGSEIRAAVNAKAYDKGGNTGVTAYLTDVQILKLVEYNPSPFDSPFSTKEDKSTEQHSKKDPEDFPPWEE